MDLQNELDKLNEKFETLYDEVIDLVSLDNRTLKEALTTQLPMQMQMEVIVKRFHYLYDECEVEVESAYGRALKDQMRDSYRDVSISEAKEYAKADPEYKEHRKLINRIRKARDEAKGVLEVLNSRKYICTSLTNSIVAGVENTIL